MIKSLLTTSTLAGSTAPTTLSTINEDGKVISSKAKKVKRGVTTTSITSSTVTLTTEYHNYKEFYSAAGYIQSIPDNELEEALTRLGLLESSMEESPKEMIKTRG